MLQTLRKPALFIAGALVFYALCGFLILPGILQAKLPGLIQQETGRAASVEKVSINPFSLEFAIEGFSLQETDAQPFAGFTVLAANIAGIDSIRNGALVIEEMRLDQPSVKLVKNKTGTFNFSDLLKQKPTQEQEVSTGVLPFLIRNFTISGGTCVWEDLNFKKPEKETIAPIDLSISELSNQGSEPGNLHLSLDLSSGARLDWTGTAVLQPLQSKGSIKLDQLSLPRLWALFLQKLPFKLKDGEAMIAAGYEFSYREEGAKLALSEAKIGIDKLKLVGDRQAAIPDVAVQQLSIAADYSVDYDGHTAKVGISGGRVAAVEASVAGTENTPGMPNLNLQGLKIGADTELANNAQGMTFVVKKGMVDLSRFDLSEKNQQGKLIEIPKLTVNGIGVDSAKQQFDVASIVSEDASVKAWLDASGALNYQTLFAGSSSSEPETADKPADSEKSWKIRLDKASVNNYRVNFTDQTQAKPVVVDLAGLSIELEDYSNEPGGSTQLQLHTRVDESGEIKINGEAVMSPLSAELSVDVNEIGLKTVQPYLEKYVRLELVDGDLSTQGHLSVALAEPEQLSLNYQGNANIARFLTRDKIQNKDFVKWNNLELGKISFNLQKQALSLEEVIFDQPYGRIIIKKDGTTNIHDILIAQQPEQKAPTSPGPAESTQKSPSFNIGKIRVKQGMSDYADYSMILPFITQMNSLDGTLIGLSSDKDATAKLTLSGKVYDLASVDIAGRYQIDTGDSAFNLKFKNMPLPLVTPYMAEFAGYKIEKGQMSLDLSYTINNGRLKAENNMFIDQFTLGEKVENPKAVSLPLKLAIALLKDSDGKINLDLPIAGSLDDPEFSVSALVFKALGNLITKIVTSPFHALASLVAGGEDLSVVNFSAGSAELDVTEMAKLNELAEALKNRPSLRLDIKGAAYQEQDWPAMRFDALKDQLKKMKAKEQKAKGTKIRAEYVELSDEDYKRLLAQLFIEKFPLLAQYSLFGTPQLKNPEQGDFYQIARQKLETIIVPEKQRLDNLAMQRASNIARYLIEQGGIAEDRVFILATELDPEKEAPGITATLSLSVEP